jgi:imidazolonepropionase-like amidohydrolase
VVTPGLVDARATVGSTGWLNQSHDQEQLETSAPLQPELRATDGYNAQDRRIEWVRGFGTTTIHTGHAPGAVVSGRTLVAKTRGASVERDVFVETAMIVATLGERARAAEGKSPAPGRRWSPCCAPRTSSRSRSCSTARPRRRRCSTRSGRRASA